MTHPPAPSPTQAPPLFQQGGAEVYTCTHIFSLGQSAWRGIYIYKAYDRAKMRQQSTKHTTDYT